MAETIDNWPAGSTWVFQGTVAEDGTGGTHVCTLTVTPGAGNEMQVIGIRIVEGNTATAQQMQAFINDGVRTLEDLILAPSDTAALVTRNWPRVSVGTANVSDGQNLPAGPGAMVSGTMNLVLQVTTTAISVTQTFAVVCRLKTGQKPTAVLADSVGTPVLTTNTNQVF